jgi:hypothetical protein
VTPDEIAAKLAAHEKAVRLRDDIRRQQFGKDPGPLPGELSAYDFTQLYEAQSDVTDRLRPKVGETDTSGPSLDTVNNWLRSTLGGM